MKKKRRGRPVLPICYRHPARKCPGECQYIAPSHACMHDLVAAGTWQRVKAARATRLRFSRRA